MSPLLFNSRTVEQEYHCFKENSLPLTLPLDVLFSVRIVLFLVATHYSHKLLPLTSITMAVFSSTIANCYRSAGIVIALPIAPWPPVDDTNSTLDQENNNVFHP